MLKKLKNRDNCLIDYNRFTENKISNIISTNIIKIIYARHERLLLCNAYIKDIALDAYNDNYGNVYYIAKNLKSDNEYLVFNKDNEVIWGNIEKSEWKRIYNKLENNKQYLND